MLAHTTDPCLFKRRLCISRLVFSLYMAYLLAATCWTARFAHWRAPSVGFQASQCGLQALPALLGPSLSLGLSSSSLILIKTSLILPFRSSDCLLSNSILQASILEHNIETHAWCKWPLNHCFLRHCYCTPAKKHIYSGSLVWRRTWQCIFGCIFEWNRKTSEQTPEQSSHGDLKQEVPYRTWHGMLLVEKHERSQHALFFRNDCLRELL